MKKFILLKNSLFIALIIFTFVREVNCQVATSTCSSVSLISPPPLPNNVIHMGSGGYSCKNCNGGCYNEAISSNPPVMQLYSRIERKVNGFWVSYGNGLLKYENYPSWNVTDQGTYRIKCYKPKIYKTSSCPNGFDVKIPGGAIVGKEGIYSGEDAQYIVYSNEVTVGPVTSNQVVYSFVDGGNGNSQASGFDFGELVRINTTGCKNYTHWWVAIFENGGANRSNSLGGWQSGALPTLVNITNIFRINHPTWNFENGLTYTVQFALSNPCNTEWTNLDKTFNICPAGSGCREVDVNEPISLSPNPTSNEFRLLNLPETESQISISDVSGRKIKNFTAKDEDTFDVSDLGNGMYFITVFNEGTSVFASKLLVVR
jgi:hypothetical protein